MSNLWLKAWPAVWILSLSTPSLSQETEGHLWASPAVNREGLSIGFSFYGPASAIDDRVTRDRLRASFSPVHEVNLLSHEVTLNEILFLSTFRELRSLQLGEAPDSLLVTTEVVNGIGKISSLESLVLHVRSSERVKWYSLSNCRKLTHLEIRGHVRIASEEFLAIVSMPNLRHLVLAAELEHTEVAWPESIAKLQTLELNLLRHNGSFGLEFPRMKQMESFKLSNVSLGSGDLQNLIAKFGPSLLHLDLVCTRDANVQILSELSNLERLAIKLEGAGHLSLSFLQNLPELRMLRLVGSVDESTLGFLARHPNLELIHLSKQGISPSAVQYLRKTRESTTVKVFGNL